MNISADKYNDQELLRENLFIFKIPQEKGFYNIPKTDTLNIGNYTSAIYFTLEDDGDVLEGVYYADSNSSSNYVEITSINKDIIEGTFEVTFLLDTLRKDRYPFLPDTVRFTNGIFKTKILIKD